MYGNGWSIARTINHKYQRFGSTSSSLLFEQLIEVFDKDGENGDEILRSTR